MNRWHVVLTYRTENGPVDIEHDVEEISEVEDLVERGPDWNALASVKITLHSPLWPDATLEEMARFNHMPQNVASDYLKERNHRGHG